MNKNNKTTKKEQIADAQRRYAGASTDAADGNRVDPKAVRQETRMLNNNPRNNMD